MTIPSLEARADELAGQAAASAARADAEPVASRAYDLRREAESLFAQAAVLRVESRVGGDPVRDHIMQYFAFSHLPAHLQAISKPFCDCAEWVHQTLPRNPERTVALRKLLEAKDAAVRAALAK